MGREKKQAIWSPYGKERQETRARASRQKEKDKKQKQIYDGDREDASAQMYSFVIGEKKPKAIWRPYGGHMGKTDKEREREQVDRKKQTEKQKQN